MAGTRYAPAPVSGTGPPASVSGAIDDWLRRPRSRYHPDPRPGPSGMDGNTCRIQTGGAPFHATILPRHGTIWPRAGGAPVGHGQEHARVTMNDFFKDYRAHVPERDEEVGKATLFRSDRLLVGLNALAPGVEQAVHTHEGQDKFYQILEGRGVFTVGEEVREASAGEVVWAAAGVEHGVRNDGRGRLVLLVGIAPAPREKGPAPARGDASA